MKTPLTDWLEAARRLESSLTSRVEGASTRVSGGSPRHPIEVIHAIVNSVGREVEAVGRDRRMFPYGGIRVSLLARSAKERARLEAACSAVPSLTDRIAAQLAAADCTGTAPAVEFVFVETPAPDWAHSEFDIEYTGPRVTSPMAIELTITHGTAAATQYRFGAAPISLGRGREVRDAGQRLLRVNDVAFADQDDAVNGSVSRQHARIEPDAAGQWFRLYDDASARGTCVIRRGRGVPVPRGTRGLRLQSGDEIVLGQARVIVALVEAAG